MKFMYKNYTMILFISELINYNYFYCYFFVFVLNFEVLKNNGLEGE